MTQIRLVSRTLLLILGFASLSLPASCAATRTKTQRQARRKVGHHARPRHYARHRLRHFRRHLDVRGYFSRRQMDRLRPSRAHLSHPGNRRQRRMPHAKERRCTQRPSPILAGWKIHRVHHRSRRPGQSLGHECRRIQSSRRCRRQRPPHVRTGMDSRQPKYSRLAAFCSDRTRSSPARRNLAVQP